MDRQMDGWTIICQTKLSWMHRYRNFITHGALLQMINFELLISRLIMLLIKSCDFCWLLTELVVMCFVLQICA